MAERAYTTNPEGAARPWLQRKSTLCIGTPGDAYEREANRAANAVVSGRSLSNPGLSLSRIPVTQVQREDGEKPKSDEEKYKEAAQKIGEAFLETEVGKKLKEKAENDPLVKGAKEAGESFIGTLPGKIITGTAAVGAVSALAATHKELPAQIPEIPLDKITPGLSVQITYEGPVDNPSKAMITFSYTEQLGGAKKPAKTKTELQREENARMALDMAKFRAGLRYKPGTPEAKQQEAEEAALKRAAFSGVGKLPDFGNVKTFPGLAQPPSALSMQFPTPSYGFKPKPFSLLDEELKLKPRSEASDAHDQEKKKKEEGAPVQRKAAGDSTPAAAPSLVNDALAAPGQPLDASTRGFMEGRFGHDFSSVRIHTDERAAQSARSVDALAYTSGANIVFSGGAYNPHSHSGKHLLAHELAHVIQQNGAATAPLFVQRQTAVGSAARSTTGVRAATAEERREFAREAILFLRGQGEFFALQPDRDIAEVLRHLRTTVENGLATVAGDPDATSVENDLRAAYRDAVRTALVARTRSRPEAIRTPPTLQELYEQNRDAILPFGLPQAQADTGASELSAELAAPLADQPTAAQRTRHAAIESARQQLRVVTASIDMPIEDLFSTRGGTTTIPLPENTTARLASTIPAALHRGLRNVAGRLMQSSLTPNTTVMLALDLTPFGGSYDAYRFTRLDLGRLGIEVLIERQGAIGIEGLRTEQRQQLRQRFDRVGFRRGTGFSDGEFDQVLIGLAEIPEAQLTLLGNLRFERQSSDPAHPDAAGHYDQDAHTVRMFDRAYSGGASRFGRGGRALKFAAHSVAHEVGHALDLSALRTTAAATETAQSALLGEFGTGGSGYRIPGRRDPERARYDELQRGVTGAAVAERAARSRSGARWSGGNPATVTDDLVRGARQPAFRQAALQDGGPAGRQMPTTYPNPESIWQEYFAESFALYQTSPDLLRQMRPNVFRYMEREFPR